MTKQKSEILIVDDDQTHRNMLKTLLNKWGYTLSEADDGQTAINMVTQRPYDLVLMDIKMIKVSGLVALLCGIDGAMSAKVASVHLDY